jgi:hypothetical protein
MFVYHCIKSQSSCWKMYIYIYIWYDMIWYDMIWYDMIWYMRKKFNGKRHWTFAGRIHSLLYFDNCLRPWKGRETEVHYIKTLSTVTLASTIDKWNRRRSRWWECTDTREAKCSLKKLSKCQLLQRNIPHGLAWNRSGLSALRDRGQITWERAKKTSSRVNWYEHKYLQAADELPFYDQVRRYVKSEGSSRIIKLLICILNFHNSQTSLIDWQLTLSLLMSYIYIYIYIWSS